MVNGHGPQRLVTRRRGVMGAGAIMIASVVEIVLGNTGPLNSS
jgi:hypothetical protein